MTDMDYCVIGAGFAGLTAALRLKQAGQSVMLLEARDRVGGRTFTEPRDDGSWIDRGGAWVGPGQDAIHALMSEFRVASFKQYTKGKSIMIVDGKSYRYQGTIPWTLSPLASANLGTAFLELGLMCKSIPLEAPWEAEKAAKWDQLTLAQWLRRNAPSRAAHDLLETAVAGLFTSAASEVSMLYALTQMASGGGPSFVFGTAGGSQDARLVGGMGAVYNAIAAELGDAVRLSTPVRRISADEQGVTIRSEDVTVRARRAIVAVPLSIASHIIYEPMLPADRSFLHQRMPGGSIIKTSVVYDEPFWRGDGLTGQTTAPGTAAQVTIDVCTDAGGPGMLCVITEGPTARRLSKAGEADRRSEILADLAARFGDKAAAPIDYVEQDWTVERYSGGGMISHAPPGVLTEFGRALRAPCGRVHWAGTESSAVTLGWVDGAVRSGERAAAEVMKADRVAMADAG